MAVYTGPGAVYEATLNFVQANHVNNCVLHWVQGPGNIDDADIGTVISVFKAAVFDVGTAPVTLAERFLNIQSNLSSYRGGRLQAFTPLVPKAPLDVPQPPTPGGITGEALPPQSSFLISKSSVGPGRSGKGRVYVPGLLESAQDNGFWSAAFLSNPDVTNLVNAIQTLGVSVVTGAGPTVHLSPCVFSRKLQAGFPTVLCVARPTVKSQRRRAARAL